jgi:hypothetical protein
VESAWKSGSDNKVKNMDKDKVVLVHNQYKIKMYGVPQICNYDARYRHVVSCMLRQLFSQGTCWTGGWVGPRAVDEKKIPALSGAKRSPRPYIIKIQGVKEFVLNFMQNVRITSIRRYYLRIFIENFEVVLGRYDTICIT